MISSAATLSNADLLDRLNQLVASDNDLTAQLVAHIGEVDARKLYTGAACPSMFSYCTDRLGLSESAAYKRIAAARAARFHPILLDALSAGRLHLTAIAMIARHLTDDNHQELIDAASGLSKRALERLLAGRSPKPDAPPNPTLRQESAASPGDLSPRP